MTNQNIIFHPRPRDSYSIERAFTWAKWISDHRRSLEHRANLIRLIKVYSPAWYFNLVAMIATLQIMGKNQTYN